MGAIILLPNNEEGELLSSIFFLSSTFHTLVMKTQ